MTPEEQEQAYVKFSRMYDLIEQQGQIIKACINCMTSSQTASILEEIPEIRKYI